MRLSRLQLTPGKAEELRLDISARRGLNRCVETAGLADELGRRSLQKSARRLTGVRRGSVAILI